MQLKPSWIIYPCFESLAVVNNTNICDSNESYTDKYQDHVACSYSLCWW